MMRLLHPFNLMGVLFSVLAFPQQSNPHVETDQYTVRLINNAENRMFGGHLKLGTHQNGNGDELSANSFYFLRNNKPWFPVMGEFHFSRYPRKQWEESILKMKASGVDIIASYIFWIYHEEEEGKFNWTGNRDLRFFVALCAKHDMQFFARIGPWCHGEARNGGFPDWLVRKGNLRKNDNGYLNEVKRFYNETGKQLQGLYFKDGGPVIGVQIENEFGFKSAEGLKHMLTLKRLAIEAGMDVPYYTATGWPSSDQTQNELIPVWGGYPAAPWVQNTAPLPLVDGYLFDSLRNDPAIGSDVLGRQEQNSVNFSGYRYPYATAEMGGGNQITYHRRPVITAPDVTALSYAKIGSGANLIGYYMYHGGSNLIGKLSTLQESRATNYANDYPIINYDFYSPIGEWGQLRESYHRFKLLHLFLNDFGDRLAPMYPSFPDIRPSGPNDNRTLRWAVRSGGNSGFVFISNFQRHLEMKAIQNVQLRLQLADGHVLTFPRKPFSVPAGLQMILPFNMDIEGAQLDYAIAQPLCKISGKEPLYVFFTPENMPSEFVFDTAGIRNISAGNARVMRDQDRFIITDIMPGPGCIAEITLSNQRKAKLLILSDKQALNAWKSKVFGKEYLFISEGEFIFYENKISIRNTQDTKMQLLIYPAITGLKFTNGTAERSAEGIFTKYMPEISARETKIAFSEISTIDEYLNKGEQLPPDNRSDKMDTSRPGPQYQTNLQPVPGSRCWRIKIPRLPPSLLADAFIRVNYTGDTGAAYWDGKLIADDFYAGLPMLIGLNHFGPDISGKELLLQIVPLTDERDIYFEKGVREPLKGKAVADIQNVSLVLQYKTIITKAP